MPKRTYTSSTAAAAEGDEVISTEGVTFDLDDVEFVCHGQMDANDLVELAPLLDAEGNWLDPAALAAVGHFYSQVMGRATWAAFSAHRRRHRTPPSVIAQIMMDLIQEVVQRPPGKPSPSPSGPETTAVSSPAVPASPASEPAVHLPPNGAVDPEGIIPREMAEAGDVILAPAPDGPPAADPLAGTVRTINLGRPGPPQVRQANRGEQAAMEAAAAG